jgi:hypothetical protein
MRVVELPPDYTRWLRINSLASAGFAYLNEAGELFLKLLDDQGTGSYSGVHPADWSDWRYVAVGLRRASSAGAADGEGVVILDGTAVASVAGLANYERLGPPIDVLLGVPLTPRDGYVADHDEIKPAHEPPDPLAPGYRIYRGEGGPEAIDWSTPVAAAPAAGAVEAAGQSLQPGRTYVYAARAVSAEGIEEGSSHILARVRVDEQGSLAAVPPPAPIELTAADLPDGNLLVGFTFAPPPGWPAGERFEVGGDGGSGVVGFDEPLAVVEPAEAGQTEFEVAIVRPAGPSLLAVRAVAGDRPGPPCPAVRLPAAAGPAAPHVIGGSP